MNNHSVKQLRTVLQFWVLPLLSLLFLVVQVQTVLLPYYYRESTAAATTTTAATDPFLRQLQDATAWKKASFLAANNKNNNKGTFATTTAAIETERTAKSSHEILAALEQARWLRKDAKGHNITYALSHDSDMEPPPLPSPKSRRRRRRHRQFPDRKLVYLLHIHKSGGTTMCQLAKFNQLSTSETNCNVQRDQRCCGQNDTLSAQTAFAREAPYDLVASEGRMYEGMDVESYQYIVVLRKSQERYFSHWKHVRRYYEGIPGARRHHHRDSGSPEAAGGQRHDQDKPHPVAVKNARGKFVSFESQHHKDDGGYSTLADLVRETKQQRRERREAKLREMEAWKQAAHDATDAMNSQHPPPQQQQPTTHQQSQHQPQPLLMPPKEEGLEDFTTDAEKNKDLFFPRRRLVIEDDGWSSQQQQQRHSMPPSSSTTMLPLTRSRMSPRRRLQEEEDEPKSDEGDPDEDPDAADAGQQHPGNDAISALSRLSKKRPTRQRRRPPGIMPHPAEDPAHIDHWRNSPHQFPLVGETFEEWWRFQPDNWNFRQLCGTHCQGIPKYQLTLQDWAYTLERFLQFDTVLFLEDLQHSVDILSQRLGWNQTSLAGMQAQLDQEEQDKAIRKEIHQRMVKKVGPTDLETVTEWYRAEKQKHEESAKRHAPPEPDREQMKEKWDPLMSVLDDALYDIGQRWEALKVMTGKLSHESSDELVAIIDIRSLPESQRDYFHLYMEDQEGNHRYGCTNECCTEDYCSAW